MTLPMKFPKSRYSVDVQGRTIEAETLADILVQALQRLEALKPGTLEELSCMSRGKRRMVARHRKYLYPGRPDLADQSRKIREGWYVGTNCSTRDVEGILDYARKAAGLAKPLVLFSPHVLKDLPLKDLMRLLLS